MIELRKQQRVDQSFCFPRLSTKDLRRMYEASLEILERVGVRLFLDEAVQLLKKAGARITDNNLAHVSPAMVENAIKTAPKEVNLYDRHGTPVMPVGGYRCFYGPGSDCLNICDHRTGKRRKPLLKDLEKGVILCDALSHVDFAMSMILPSDVDGTIADRYQMETLLSHTTKPIIYVSYEMGGCRDAVKMAEVVMESSDALQKKPTVACYINAISGLKHNKEALEKLLFLAGKNLPSLYIPSSTAAVTSPVTPAGSVALDYAGVLVGLTLSQLKREGAPVIVPGMSACTFDMRTFVSSYCEPERTISLEMGHYLGYPTFAAGGVSESKTVDSQAAAEAALTLLVETLAGGNIIHDLGYLESGLTFSFSQLVLCDEIVSWIKAFTAGFEVNDETLALDVIAELGADGDFLGSDHTLEHFRERWYPTFFERGNYDSWLKKGGKNFAQRAAEVVDHILAEHEPEPLPSRTKRKLREIVLKAK